MLLSGAIPVLSGLRYPLARTGKRRYNYSVPSQRADSPRQGETEEVFLCCAREKSRSRSLTACTIRRRPGSSRLPTALPASSASYIRRQQRQCQKPAGCALPVHRSGDADHDHRRRSGCRRGAGCAGAVPCRGVSLWSRPDLLNQRGAAGKAGRPSLQKCAGTGQASGPRAL